MTDHQNSSAESARLLELCPFCGGEAERFDDHDAGSTNEGGSCIQCKACQASTPMHFDRKEHLYSSWNERAAYTNADDAEEMKRLLQENGALRRVHLCVREYQDHLRRSTNVGPVTNGPHKEARLLRALYEAAANAHAILEGRPDECPVCNGDCAGANPPVFNCPRLNQ